MHAHAANDHGGGPDWVRRNGGEAGEFEHILGGGSSGPLAASPIDHLPADTSLSGHNTVTETTSILFETSPGGTIDIGGNVEAFGAGDRVERVPIARHGSFLHAMQVETTNIIFDVASGGTIDIGGNVEALGVSHGAQRVPIARFGKLPAQHAGRDDEYHFRRGERRHDRYRREVSKLWDFSRRRSTRPNRTTRKLPAQPAVRSPRTCFQRGEWRRDRYRRQRGGLGRSVAVWGLADMDSGASCKPRRLRTTSIIFNVATGGTIDIGGNVEAASAQQSHVEPNHAAAHLA